MENESRIAWLLTKSMKNELSSIEEEELANWLAVESNRKFVEGNLNVETLAQGVGVLDRMDRQRLQQKLDELRFSGKSGEVSPGGRPDEIGFAGRPDVILAGQQAARIIPIYKYLAVAGLAVLLGIGAWWFSRTQHTVSGDKGPATSIVTSDISPGGDKAILTLAGGERIVLDSARNGKLAQQGNVDLVVAGNGQLAYKRDAGGNADTTPANARTGFNMLSTPRGGQYRVTLSDGTQVWLNAASSIRYPTAFTGKERVVEITGEAYFEVSPNENMPFTVKANGTDIHVLGTAFDIMSYENEAEQDITLTGGAVRVSKGNASRVLKAGQQARLAAAEGSKVAGGSKPAVAIRVVDDADLEDVLAWKNNLFSFNDASIETVMRQLARWYDVDVKYAGAVSQHFNGNIPRGVGLSRVFVMLELTGKVHFSIEGRQIVVHPI